MPAGIDRAKPDRPRKQPRVGRPQPLSVLFFSPSSSLGGAEQGVLELVAELITDHGTACAVVCPGGGPLVEQLQAVGAITLVEPDLGWWAGRSEKKILGGVRALLKLTPALQQLDPAVVYTQSITIPWGASAAALLDKPHLWSICEFGELDYGLKFLDSFADILEQVKAGASFIRTPSEAVRLTLFPDLPADRVRTIYRHSRTLPARMRPAEDAFRRAGATRLAVFGTLHEGKGQLDAVEAVARLLANGSDVELLLAGHSIPEYRAEVEASIIRLGLQDRVRISNFLPDPFPTMLAADIVLVCSRNEAFGRVVVEGMKLGRPVVYARSGGIPEYMQDGVTGLSYQPGDVDELAERIEELIANPERARQIGAAARRYACAKFTRNGSEILEVLHKLQRLQRGTRRVAMPKRVVASLASIAIEGSVELKRARAKLQAIENSRSFALARAVSWPLRWLKSNFHS